VQALLAQYDQFAILPTKRSLTVLPKLQAHILADEGVGRRPTRGAVESAAAPLAARLPASTNEAIFLQGIPGQWFVAFSLDPKSNKLTQEDNKTILRGLEAHDFIESARYEYLGHISVFATGSREVAKSLRQRLTDTVKSGTGRLLFGGVVPVPSQTAI